MEKSPTKVGFSKSERKGNSREENFPNSIQDFRGENSCGTAKPEIGKR